MKVKKGNLIDLTLEGRFDLIFHGCNCFCTMGGGVAKAIKEAFPEAYDKDCLTVKGDPRKLGTCSQVDLFDKASWKWLTVVNAYTQFSFGSGKQVEYGAVRSCMKRIKEIVEDNNRIKRIGFPKIGAGLAGGDWDVIKDIIDEELAGLDITLVELLT